MPSYVPRHHDQINLLAFLAVLVFGAVLIAVGVPAASLIVVTFGLTQLYAAFRTGRTAHMPATIEQVTHADPTGTAGTPGPTGETALGPADLPPADTT
ncbi:hypothetical protein [Streptomyces sp. NPDC020817]|uniref:hypothetical protein n=1 Tax=Streptomyces sp. NPDC020817 TaxID=3365095 RepID=UPI0037928B3E